MTRLAVLAALGLCASAGLDGGRLAEQPPASASGCGAIATFADGKAPARILHVAVTGSDTRGNGSAGRPFRTIGRAAGSVAPGTAIHLHAGTYDGGTFLANLRGTAAEPIWISGAPGEARPSIAGGDEGLHLIKPRYVVLEHLEIFGAADHGINVDDGDETANEDAARFLLFRDLDIHDTGARPSGVPNCLKLAGLNDFVVRDSVFARCGDSPASGAVGVDGVGVHRGTVAFNRFVATGFGGVQVKGGSADVDVRSNFFQNAGWRGVQMGGSTGRAYFRPPLRSGAANFEAARIRARANIFDGGEAAVAFTGCIDCSFSHNTVVNPSKWAIRILQESVTTAGQTFAPAANGLVAGNIFYFRRSQIGAEDVNVGPHTNAQSFTFARNLWYAHDDPGRSRPSLPGVEPPNEGSLVGASPDFVDALTGDFHLTAGSAARGAGQAPLAPESDFDGHCYGRPPSLGALEGYVSARRLRFDR